MRPMGQQSGRLQGVPARLTGKVRWLSRSSEPLLPLFRLSWDGLSLGPQVIFF